MEYIKSQLILEHTYSAGFSQIMLNAGSYRLMAEKLNRYRINNNIRVGGYKVYTILTLNRIAAANGGHSGAVKSTFV